MYSAIVNDPGGSGAQEPVAEAFGFKEPLIDSATRHLRLNKSESSPRCAPDFAEKPFGLPPASSVTLLLVGHGCSSTSASRRATQNSDSNGRQRL
jgi:hypothetical protein